MLRKASLKQPIAAKPDADHVRTEFIEKRAAELVARGVPLPTEKEAIERQCGGEPLSDVVLPFDDPELQGCTVGDVLAADSVDKAIKASLVQQLLRNYCTQYPTDTACGPNALSGGAEKN